jgi:cytochrome c
MYRWLELGLGACAALVLVPALAQDKATTFNGIGRQATPAEVRAWDIDVRPDFKGLPKGSGSVAKGQDLWESKCASCHGVFGEATDVFTPITTGIAKEDIKTGHASGLTKEGGTRSTLMKVASLSTLWDYINRAMPWNAPKTLTTDEVYAATAYILNLADILPADFVLSDQNIAAVQAMMPNRLGMTTSHGLWSAKAKPDVQGSPCMKNCTTDVKVVSFLPDYAKNAHGNLIEQMRLVGGVRGVDTDDASHTAMHKPTSEFAAVRDIANKATCLACHGLDKKVVGPGFNDVAAKYKTLDQAEAYLARKIRSGGQGIWGSVPMPPATVSDAEAAKLAHWILRGTPD